jgi:hypothetical protein
MKYETAWAKVAAQNVTLKLGLAAASLSSIILTIALVK